MALRFHNLGAQSFWNDEGNSARLSERTIQLIIEGTASDIHPPLYYLLLRGWRELAGDSEFGLRSLSAFAGLLVVPLAIALAKNPKSKIRNPQWLLVGVITAVSPPLIYYSQEARMYALLGLLAALSTWLLVRSAECGVRNWSFAVAYVLTATAGLYTHYFFPAVLVAQGVVVVIWAVRDWRLETGDWRLPHSALRTPLLWAVMMLVTLLLYLPWLPTFLANVGGGGAARPSLLPFLADTLFWLGFGLTVSPVTIPWAFVALGVLLVLAVVLRWGWDTAVSLTLLFVPILFLYLSGATSPQYFKFLTAVIAPFALVLGGQRLETRDWRLVGRANRQSPIASLFILLLLLAYSVGVYQSLHNLYANPAYARADYRGMAARIAADDHPNAGIILDAPNQWEVFTYYHREGAPVYPLPLEGMTEADVAAELSAIAAQHDRLYVLYWGDAQQDPQRWVERWLDEHTFKATDEWVKDVRFVVYAVPAGPATAMETAVSLPFGDAITLQGYTLGQTTLAPGDIAQVTLFWQTAVPLAARYKVFLHLVDENGNLAAQRDSEPGSNLKPTTIWPPGETITDNHGLLIPADLPPGEYTLLLGLYDVADPGARLEVGAETAVNNAYPLAQITINK
ncbi:MAG: glycosyltransferase family 39 protein [Chloroflexi bacterium]|nr:glycosyltransferase family 39 protein [Chloroflexota bacterium]MBP7044064.1 glycosyltransferase family 39 protein [Chloroflexota bacterium]